MAYTAQIAWQRNDVPFNPKSFKRDHNIQFGSGIKIEGSSAPEYLGNNALVNPEELFTASIASCFMLTLLYWASTKNIIIDTCEIAAAGTLAKNAEGKMAMTEVVLNPKLTFQENKQPETSVLEDLYKKAHDNCFISCSVKTKVVVQG